MGPIAQSDGHDPPAMIGELVPGVAAKLDDVVVGIEGAVEQPVVARELPDAGGEPHPSVVSSRLTANKRGQVTGRRRRLRADQENPCPAPRTSADQVITRPKPPDAGYVN